MRTSSPIVIFQGGKMIIPQRKLWKLHIQVKTYHLITISHKSSGAVIISRLVGKQKGNILIKYALCIYCNQICRRKTRPSSSIPAPKQAEGVLLLHTALPQLYARMLVSRYYQYVRRPEPKIQQAYALPTPGLQQLSDIHCVM